MRYSSRFMLVLAALMHAGFTTAMPSGNTVCPGPPSVLMSLLEPEVTCPGVACSATVPCCTCFICSAGTCIL
ncbi:hypothetical protein C8R44DRAFT_882691 [Mycena epipterygia]|nr:hypothetical protein C8R44DRAFT_882691 [Mycena epipterygia]